MDLTLDKAIAYHRQLWDWLSENPEKEKKDWSGWEDLEELNPELNGHCFACMMSVYCCDCVLEWPGTGCCHLTEESKEKGIEDGLFASWDNTSNEDTRAALARQIRDLPVRYPAEMWNPLEAWRDA